MTSAARVDGAAGHPGRLGMMSTNPQTEVVEGTGRFEILLDGAAVGHAEYVDDGDQRTFPHTFIQEAHRGRGLAGQLVREALDVTGAQGKTAIPACSAVAAFISANPEYRDLVPEDRRAEFGL